MKAERPCVWCGDKTDYHTFDERPICISCAREKGEDLFNRFGRLLNLVKPKVITGSSEK
jgi:hypothetical protein